MGACEKERAARLCERPPAFAFVIDTKPFALK